MNELDKQEKQALSRLNKLSNKVKADFSFHKIKTVGDYFRCLGYSDNEIGNVLHYRANELDKPISFGEVKSRLDDLRVALTTKFWLERNPPQGLSLNGDTPIIVSEQEKEIILNKNNDYGLEKVEGENVSLRYFQKRDAQRLLTGIHKGLKAQMLIGKPGFGKTIVLGAVLNRLKKNKFHEGKTVSPWPYFYVTKASVVDQTKEDLEIFFGLDTVKDVYVTNYDQLRATLGELYIEEKKIVENGIARRVFVWRKLIHPIVFVFDECQAACYRTSQQGQIVRCVSKIESPHVYCIFSSATPFSKISESDYFVLNTRMEYNTI